MSETTTIEAPANIAFVKYWGALDLDNAIPVNPSISMTLSRCVSRTSVQCLPAGLADEIWLAEQGGLRPAAGAFAQRALDHLGTLRDWAGVDTAFRVATRNSFPAAAGMASSASGFAALTLAVVRALGRSPQIGELSELARRSGSGSAARSVMGGYVQWPAGPDPTRCRAEQIATAAHWDLRDIVALVQTGPKKVSSLEGHRRAPSSPHFARRQELLPDRLAVVREAIASRSIEHLGPVLERDAVELHLVGMSSRPPIFYWRPATLAVLECVRDLRDGGAEAYFTMDAGANVHVICPPEAEESVAVALAGVPGVEAVMRDRVGSGPRQIDESLL